MQLHRDTEKSEGMFGTLIIQLPSNYSGGQLAVYHQSKSMEFDFGGPAGYNNFHYAAFYADCQHEIKPVTEGHRLCLIYNLLYRGSGECPAPDNSQFSTIVSSMREWSESPDDPLMMTYLLEHKYCEYSLSFQLLKNKDRAVADILTLARKEVEFDLYLAQVILVQNWSANEDDYIEDDLNEESAKAEHLVSLNGHIVRSIDIDEECFVPKDFFYSIEPDKEDFEDTGNEGTTVDKQFKWAALLLWPSKNRMANLGITDTIHSLKNDQLDLSISQDKKIEIAKYLIRSCGSHHHGCLSTEGYVSLLQSLQSLGNVELISEFLGVIASSMYDHGCLMVNFPFTNEILTIGSRYGWDMLRPSLQAIFDNLSSSRSIENYCRFIYMISHHQPSEAQKDVCQGLATAIVSVLSNESDTAPVYMSYSASRGKEFVIPLFKCLTTLECNKQLLSFVETLSAKSNRYSVPDMLAPVCEDLYKSLKDVKTRNEPLHQLLVYCISYLEVRSHPPSCPTDWSEPVTFSCSCADCVTLMRFLKDAQENQHYFKIRKRGRRHLESQLDDNGCSVTHVTDSRHILVVTKTRAAYNTACQKYEEEKATLSRLRVHLRAVSSSGEPMQYCEETES